MDHFIPNIKFPKGNACLTVGRVVYSVRVAVVGQSTNNNKNEIGLIQIPKRY